MPIDTGVDGNARLIVSIAHFMDNELVEKVLEAALLSSDQPMALAELRRLFDDELDAGMIRSALVGLAARWHARHLELVELAGGFRFQTRAEAAPFLARLTIEKPARYSRAVMETLAIIAYRQPVTRGEIEEIRGVTVSTQVIRSLEDRGWIETIGHKDVLGRPALLATTRQFLDDLGLRSLQNLPALGAMVAEAVDPSGLLEGVAPALPQAGALVSTDPSDAQDALVAHPADPQGQLSLPTASSMDDDLAS